MNFGFIMKIITVSYHHKKQENDPGKWLGKISFFECILQELANRAEVINISFINWSGELTKGKLQHIFLQKNLLTATHFLSQLRPDVVLVQGFHSSIYILYLKLFLRSKAKIVIQHRAERPSSRRKKYLQKLADKYVDAYFFASVEQSQEWINAGIIRHKKKVHEILGASSIFKTDIKDEARQKLSLPLQAKIILWVGRLNSNKDPQSLVQAFTQYLENANVDSYLYIIYRSDELITEVISLIDKKGFKERIILCGAIPHQDLQYWYNASDFIINTSHYEGGNISVIEAMSCGCIPIVPDIPSFSKHTNSGNIGITYPPGNVEALTNAFMHTDGLDTTAERKKVLEYHTKHLSPPAIASSIIKVVSAL